MATLAKGFGSRWAHNWPMSFHIRPAVLGDIGTVRDLAVEMVLSSRSLLRTEVPDSVILQARQHNLGQLEDLLDLPDGGLFVAVDEHDRVVGHVIVLCNNVDSVTDMTQAWVYDLSVRPQWWGQGVGRRLMEVAEDFARSRGISWIGLGVTAGNQRALGFYEEIGYRTERVQMAKRFETDL